MRLDILSVLVQGRWVGLKLLVGSKTKERTSITQRGQKKKSVSMDSMEWEDGETISRQDGHA